jgi:hypothetical protein
MITVGGDSKTRKGQGDGWLTAITYLVPAGQMGLPNLCPWASEGCTKGCLFSAGRGKFSNVQKARYNRTMRFVKDRDLYLRDLQSAIWKARRFSAVQGMKLCVRLNGTSDIKWENYGVIDAYPDLQFYDYTKSISRMNKFLRGEMPKNYHLTFSVDESNFEQAIDILSKGGNVAMVFDEVPNIYAGYKVIDGDKNDLRFLDRKGVIVGLKAKGDAIHDTTGFVHRVLERKVA